MSRQHLLGKTCCVKRPEGIIGWIGFIVVVCIGLTGLVGRVGLMGRVGLVGRIGRVGLMRRVGLVGRVGLTGRVGLVGRVVLVVSSSRREPSCLIWYQNCYCVFPCWTSSCCYWYVFC